MEGRMRVPQVPEDSVSLQRAVSVSPLRPTHSDSLLLRPRRLERQSPQEACLVARPEALDQRQEVLDPIRQTRQGDFSDKRSRINQTRLVASPVTPIQRQVVFSVNPRRLSRRAVVFSAIPIPLAPVPSRRRSRRVQARSAGLARISRLSARLPRLASDKQLQPPRIPSDNLIRRAPRPSDSVKISKINSNSLHRVVCLEAVLVSPV